MKSILMKNKKGVLGLDVVKALFLMLVVLVVLGVAGILATVSLRDSGIFGAGTLEKNQTTAIVNNYSAGIASFFGNTSTIISILVVVVIIAAIGIVIAIISRFGGTGGRSTGL